MIYKIDNGQETPLITQPDGFKSIYKYSNLVHYAYLDVTVTGTINVTTYQFAVNGRNGDCGIFGLGTTDASVFSESWCIWFKKTYEQEIMGAKKINNNQWRIFFKSRNYCNMGFTPLFAGVKSMFISDYTNKPWESTDWDVPCHNKIVVTEEAK